MIKNEKEYRTTKSAVVGYEEALSKFDILKSIEQGIDPVIANAQRSSYERQIEELNAQLGAYENLRDGGLTEFALLELTDLGEKLISARIARGLTQRELAARAGLKEQQIQRYEKEAYASANLRRVAYIASVLGIAFSGEMRVPESKDVEGSEFFGIIDPSDFPLSEMNAKGWLGRGLDLRRSSAEEKKRALVAFFSQSGLSGPPAALHRKTKGSRSAARDAALMAWQARVLAKAKSKSGLARRYTPLSPKNIQELVSLSTEKDGHLKAVEMLLEFGVIVIFEKHLKGTKLDGAAMSLQGKYAVVGMTLRFDRLDNFWFVLLHELGHVTRHWGPLLRDGFLDEEGDVADTLEDEANEFALTAVVSDELWNSSFVRYTKSADVVREFASRMCVHPALIAGRIRNERDSYSEFSELLGSGEVRSTLERLGLLE